MFELSTIPVVSASIISVISIISVVSIISVISIRLTILFIDITQLAGNVARGVVELVTYIDRVGYADGRCIKAAG